MTLHAAHPLAACALAALVCCTSCASREERADAAFAELIAAIDSLTAQLALIDSEQAAEAAAEPLQDCLDDVWDALAEVDKYGEDPELPQEARRRIGEKYHEGLSRALGAALEQGGRLGARRLYRSPKLDQLSRHAYAHFSSTGRHPWPRAVLRGREYRPKPRKQ